MTKQIGIRLEIEENESIENISKIIQDALSANNINYIEPIQLEDYDHFISVEKAYQDGYNQAKNELFLPEWLEEEEEE